MNISHRYSGVRAGNGTRTRDPNLGKVVLYQLSYSRVRNPIRRLHPYYIHTGELFTHPGSGGEGNRTPDLLNAIQALSQLSYAPDGESRTSPQEPKKLPEGRSWVKRRNWQFRVGVLSLGTHHPVGFLSSSIGRAA